MRIPLSDGAAELEWVTDSTFRFSRRWEGGSTERPQESPEAVSFQLSDKPTSIELSTKSLLVTISKTQALLRVAESDGTVIMEDLSEPQIRDGLLWWERSAPVPARFFGLGPRENAPVDLRGTRTAAMQPFLISSAGYGEYHLAPGKYLFDLAKTRPDRYTIEARGARSVDYYFFYGPTLKDVLEQKLRVDGPIDRPSPSKFAVLSRADVPREAYVLPEDGASWSTLADTVRRLINGSLSGIILPALGLTPYEDGPVELRERAKQLGSVLPIVYGSNPAELAGSIRSQLRMYLATYLEEARDRGYPLIRPLAMQFSKDPEGARYDDEFMVGDEILAAPICQRGGRRKVYLPMGIWTDLRTNQTYQGRQVITIDAPAEEIPLFSRNGAILPLGADPMVLHYFPRLGGEFFLLESDLDEYSQVHAAPAGDLIRLEIESKKDREYEWVVHHIDRARRVTASGQEFAEASGGEPLQADMWHYDAGRRNLHVRVRARAGADHIVNITF